MIGGNKYHAFGMARGVARPFRLASSVRYVVQGLHCRSIVLGVNSTLMSRSVNTVLEMADLVPKTAGKPLNPEIRPAIEDDTNRTTTHTTRAQKELGWLPRIEIEIGLKAQVARHLPDRS